VRVRRVLLLGGVIAACLVLLTLQSRGRGALTGQAIGLVTAPLQTALTKISRGAVGMWTTYVDWKAFRVEALRVRETEEENARLRRLLALQQRLPLATLAGEVIGREWGWARALTVNRGSADRIIRMTPAINPEGLVGRVVEVRIGSSIIQTINDPASTVGGTVQRTRTTGIVEGEPSGGTRFKYMARDGEGLRVGDLVVTSGLGGLFPKGIPIGRVDAVTERGSALFQYAALTPVVDFQRLEEVLLLTGHTAVDLVAHFPGTG
jgi:rod shape-determining protein MreC